MKKSLEHYLNVSKYEINLPRYVITDDLLYYQDNKCNVLGVAHLDSVGISNPIIEKDYVEAMQLDDRLGVWILMYLLPKHFGIQLDILLTDNEEKCQSTAIDFYPNKRYNWVVEFDRAGMDVVFYQYKEFAEQWNEFECSYGSYSDICNLSHLNCMCANIGIGYYQQHTNNCFAYLPHTIEQVTKFTDFYHKNKNRYFPFDGYAYERKMEECIYSRKYNNDFSEYIKELEEEAELRNNILDRDYDLFLEGNEND